MSLNLGHAIAVERGCGRRKASGVYAECGLSAFGQPIEYFLVDPPNAISDEMGKSLGVINPDGTVNARGVRLIEREGVWHILDVVGQDSYPNVADIIEEIRRFGLSRRCELASREEYAKITKDSKILLAHARGWTDQFQEYVKSWGGSSVAQYDPCPKNLPEHGWDNIETAPMCAGVWWQDVDSGAEVKDGGWWETERQMPSFSYQACRPPQSLSDPSTRGYQLAICASFPITRLVVIRDAESDGHMKKMVTASCAGVPVDLEEE